jgi:hypothetical protein
LTYINALRDNNGSASCYSEPVNLDFIIDEERENANKGHRRQDLICFNKYGGGSYNWAWKGNVANGTLN